MNRRSTSSNTIFYIFLAATIMLVSLLGATAYSLGAQLFGSWNASKTSEALAESPHRDLPIPTETPTIFIDHAPAETATEFPEPTSTLTPATPCQRPEHVLVIVLDGMRPDAIWRTSKAPYILDLARHQGAYTWYAQTVNPSKTLPAHTSLLTGYDVPIHGVTGNDVSKDEGAYLKTKSLFHFAKEHNWFTALVAGKKKLSFLGQPGVVDVQQVYKEADNFTVAEYTIQVIGMKGFGFMLINFSFTDAMGHAEGWMSDPYLEAVAQADQAVRYVLSVLNDHLETTLIVITADHGGLGYTHSLNRPEDETIPWIITGPCVKEGFELPSEPRVRIFDTAPTILWALGWEIPPDSSGRVIREAFEEIGFSEVGTP